MRRLLKALPLTLTVGALSVAALTLLAVGCGSSSSTQARVINAIDALGSQTLDVYANGNDLFPNMAGGATLPAPGSTATYTPTASGTNTIQVYPHGSTSGGLFQNPGANLTLNGSTKYTLLLGGQYGIQSGNGAPNLYLLTDNNTAPTTGYLNIRVIDGALYLNQQGGFDIYLVPAGTVISNPSFSGLTLGQTTNYLSEQAFSSGYTLVVTPKGLPNSTLFSQTYPNITTSGQIFTIVLLDNSNQSGLGSPVLLTDVN